ncbi:hypothetical protein M758_1G212200 [Ceratodon purpureus]|nr:hypothetical protein M758_1G212200 [Ceratodon purpureus]
MSSRVQQLYSLFTPFSFRDSILLFIETGVFHPLHGFFFCLFRFLHDFYTCMPLFRILCPCGFVNASQFSGFGFLGFICFSLLLGFLLLVPFLFVRNWGFVFFLFFFFWSKGIVGVWVLNVLEV